jgi:hypothetical protein
MMYTCIANFLLVCYTKLGGSPSLSPILERERYEKATARTIIGNSPIANHEALRPGGID